MKYFAITILVACLAWLGSGCASMTARGDVDHQPGTTYPGAKLYSKNWDTVGHLMDETPGRYDSGGPVMRGIYYTLAFPFVAGDWVCSGIFDTIVWPYDKIQGMGNKERAYSPELTEPATASTKPSR